MHEHTVLKNWNGIIIISNHVLPLMTCYLYNLQVHIHNSSKQMFNMVKRK
jgi:hypothetical protein